MFIDNLGSALLHKFIKNVCQQILMRKGIPILCMISLAFFSSVTYLRGDGSYLLRINVFSGMLTETDMNERPKTVWSASKEPRIAPLLGKAGAQDAEWSAGVIETLFNLIDLESVNDLFMIAKTWDGKPSGWIDKFLGDDAVFRLETLAKKNLKNEIAFQITLYRSKEGAVPRNERPETKLRRAIDISAIPKRMNMLLDMKLVLAPDDPVIIYCPTGGGAYFISVILAGDTALRASAAKRKMKSEYAIPAAPHPTKQVQACYPESLRRRRIEGRVGLRVTVNKTGAVISAQVISPLHPYLDYATVQAIYHWQFEPVIRNGKPTIAEFPFWFAFNCDEPKAGPLKEDIQADGVPDNLDLKGVLTIASEYGRKLLSSVLNYVCEETINDITYRIRQDSQDQITATWQSKSLRTNMGVETGMIGVPITIMDPQLTRKIRFLCDYQLVSDGNIIKERRVILKQGGRKVNKGLVLEEKRYSALVPALAGARFFSPDALDLFEFRIIGKKSVHGEESDIIEALPKSWNEEGIERARIWVNRKTGQIRRCEVTGVPLEGYEDVLSDCVLLGIHPNFVMTYEYGIDHMGIGFPSRTSVRIEYPMPVSLGGSILKATIEMKYSEYKYFTVSTESAVKK